MEHRKNVKTIIIFSFLFLIGGFVWYFGVPKSYETKKSIETPISSKEAMRVVEKFDADREYYLSKDVLLQKNKTWIPLVFKTDTIQQTKEQLYNRKR